MRIAYLILCHTDPQHIVRLTRKITGGTSNVAFVHVDGKSDISPFLALLTPQKQVEVLQNRTNVFWGGYSAIEATIGLMKAALSYGPFDRFVLLQGLEYPIKSNREIEEFFESHSTTEFIKAQNISTAKDYKSVHKYRLYYYLDRLNRLPYKLLEYGNRILVRSHVIPYFKRNYVRDCQGNKMEIYQGCAQFGLTDKAVRYIVDFHDRNPKFNRYFESVYAADEAYFHTIIYNSPFVKYTVDGKAVSRQRLEDFENLTYFEYPVYVTLFKEKKDWEKLKESGFLYFRKASSESKELLDFIDEEHGKEMELFV